MSKKNRHLYLAIASGCTLVEFFLIRPPFLIGHVIWKHLPFVVLFYCISQLLRIVGCYYLAILLNFVLDHSVEVTFRQDKYFLTFCFFVSFSVQAYLHAYILLHKNVLQYTKNKQR